MKIYILPETIPQATCSRTAVSLVHGEQHFEILGNAPVKGTKSLFAHLLVIELLHLVKWWTGTLFSWKKHVIFLTNLKRDCLHCPAGEVCCIPGVQLQQHSTAARACFRSQRYQDVGVEVERLGAGEIFLPLSGPRQQQAVTASGLRELSAAHADLAERMGLVLTACTLKTAK